MNMDPRVIAAVVVGVVLLLGLLALFPFTRVFAIIAWKLVKVVTRFLTGQPLDGKFRTNATFLSVGTDDTREKSFWSFRNPSRWAYLPGYHRLAIRLFAVVFSVAFLVWPAQLRVITVVTLGVVLGVAMWRGFVAFTMYRHRRDVVYPLHAALCGVVGHPSSVQPEDWLEIPVDYEDMDARMVLRLPEDFPTADGKLVRTVAITACQKLGLDYEDMQCPLHPQTSAPWLELKHAPKVPALVEASELFELMEKAPQSAPILGLSASGAVSVDLDAEAPHALLSIGSGGGKSNLAYGQSAQMLHKGAHVLVFDYKRHSLKVLRDHPNVTYLRDIEDIHNGLLWLAAEGEARNRLADDLADDEELPFTRLYAVLEEQNVTMRKLSRYWKRIRDKKEDPERSPAVDAIEDVASMGRAVMEHLLSIAQFGSTSATGGSAVRENYSNRILGRNTQNVWRMLAPEISPIPRQRRIVGRVYSVLAGHATETQVARWTPDEVREWAWSGDFSQPPNLALGFLPRGNFVEKLSTEALDALPPAPASAAVDQVPELETGRELVTLRQAVELGIESVQPGGNDTFDKALMRIRKARQEDPEFPEPEVKSRAGDKWVRGDLEFWARNRIRAGARVTEEVFE
jgi:hypothetical protein